MKKLIFISIFMFSIQSFACTCNCKKGCSFSSISDRQNFVALVKVIEYTGFLEDSYDGYENKMPYSMTVEIIKKYKGAESKKRIKIWGDDGMLCRPYIANFEVGKYYLIAPSQIGYDSEKENKDDYDFFACYKDYLEVDYEKQIAHGEYSWWRKKISLEKFERKLDK